MSFGGDISLTYLRNIYEWELGSLGETYFYNNFYETHLRTNCSSLNLHLFIKNISDSPLCSCGSIEDNQHYFFHCMHYQRQRNELLNAIARYTTPTLNLLLYGDPSLSYETNTAIFENVHKYIIDTKRF